MGYARGRIYESKIDTTENGIFLICVSDRKTVMRGYMKVGKPNDRIDLRKIADEITRICMMSVEDLESFLKWREVYNPFLDRKRRAKTSKQDLNLRAEISSELFQEGTRMTASMKRTISHDWEKLVVSRMFGGSSYARSRFSRKLYALLCQAYGHEDHGNKDCFYNAQMIDREQFMRNLIMVACRRTHYGMTLGAHTTHIVDLDLVNKLADISTAYVNKKCIK